MEKEKLERLTIGAITSLKTDDNKTGSWRAFRPVIDNKKCTRCGLCIKNCPDAGMGMNEGVVYIDYEYCKGCMVCASVCPVNAIKKEKEKK